MSSPQISILVPMRNAERYVALALASVLEQRDVDLEIIVINDGSTDRSAEIVREMGDPRIRMIDGPESGISDALNAGLAEAKAPIVARCDADDLFLPDRLARQVRWLNEHPDVGAVCGKFHTITPSGQRAAELRFKDQAEDITQELLSGKPRTHLCTYAIRVEILRRIGGCRKWFATAEDLDLQFRLAETAQVHYEPIECYAYRLHGESITHKQGATQRAFYESCAQEFLEQRRTTGQDDLERGSPPAPPASSATGHDPFSRRLQKMLIRAAWIEHRRGEKRKAIGTGFKACMAKPANIGTWKSFALLILKRA